jgi:hypothetical protein
VALVASACGGTPPKGTSPHGEVKVIATADPDVDDDGPIGQVDVSPVTPPGELVVHLRWKNPGASANAAASLAGLASVEMNASVQAIVRELVRDGLSDKVDADAFRDHVSLEAPVDVVLIADVQQGGQVPEPIYAVSVPLTSLDRALAASRGRPQQLAPGVWQIGTEDQWGEPCAIAAAAGKAPARLVCADSTTDLQRVAAYTARNVASLPEPPRDLRIDIKLRGLLDKYGRQWANQARGLPVLVEEFKRDVPKFDTALMDAADALAAEAANLIHDADSLVIDAGIDAQKGADVSVQLKFAGAQSWLVKTMIDGADQAGPAPAITWQLPASAQFVSWGKSGDPQRFDPIVKTLHDLLEGFLEAEKFGTAADRDAIAKLLRRVQKGSYVASTMATGHFPPSAPAAGGSKTLADIASDVVGWYLVGVDEGPAEMTKWLEDAVKAYNRAGVQQWLKTQAAANGNAQNLPVVKKVAAPAGLGAGSMAVEIIMPQIDDPLSAANPNATGPTKVDIKATIVLMADGKRTWLGMALDTASLAKLMQGLKGTGGTTLATRTGLDRMKTESHAGGSLASIDGMLGMVTPIIQAIIVAPGTGSISPIAQQALGLLAGMPNQGQTPILMFADVQAGSAPTLSYSLSVPKESFQDLAHLVKGALKLIP